MCDCNGYREGASPIENIEREITALRERFELFAKQQPTVVEWDEKQTQAGIQLAGFTTIKRRGRVIATQITPIPQGQDQVGNIQFGFLVTFLIDNAGQPLVRDAMTCRIVDDDGPHEEVSVSLQPGGQNVNP
jgi:hypothetical protein